MSASLLRTVALCAPLLAAVLAPVPSYGKRLASKSTPAAYARPAATSAAALQERMTPYLQLRAGVGRPVKGVTYTRPTQADLFVLARQWADLSPSFQSLYLAAAQIPPGLSVYQSPGGHFDVLYTVDGIDRVDAADTYGYGPADWRRRSTGPNGVPDYIDEVAWACDSAWSMEIDRFGFAEPYAARYPSYPSDRYKVVLRNFDSTVVNGDTVTSVTTGYYGLTYPVPTPSAHTSYTELRNNWNGEEWRNVAGNNYERDPELAVRITCAHEYHHGSQYAMAHEVVASIYLDDFPVTWIEATAVLMEELGYDSVNDYVQYCGDYFSNPQASMFARREWGTAVYKNSVLAIHMYESSPSTPPIGLFRTVFTTNQTARTPFGDNLEQTSNSFGARWAEMLGSFHAGSYFTGARAKTGSFIREAALLPEWATPPPGDATFGMSTATDTVEPYGMAMFAHARLASDGDQLGVHFMGTRASTTEPYDGRWAVNVLLRPTGAPYFDTSVAMSVNADGADTIGIDNWRDHAEALVVVTNGDEAHTGEARVSFDTVVVALLSAELLVYPNPLRVGDALVRKTGITFRRRGLRSVQIYTVDGTLVWRGSTGTHATDSISWAAENRRERVVAPGTYFALVEYADNRSTELAVAKRKLLLLP